jgi:lipopolysaccharide transport system ATP-binding protein
VVGRNGAGKSTLLRLLGGVGVPDEGAVSIRGRVGGLLELTAGFHSDLTGRENVMVGGVVRGLRRREVRERFDAIVAFAELAAVIDHPLRTYSTGMQMRLAFAVAINCHPDVLLVDEVLAVGDLAFQRKCLDATSQLRTQGTAIVVVSHDLPMVATMCDDAVHLRGGRVVGAGAAAAIADEYYASMHPETVKQAPAAAAAIVSEPASQLVWGRTRFGSMDAVFDQVQIGWLEPDEPEAHGQLQVALSCKAERPVQVAIFVKILSEDGRLWYETNTEAARVIVPTLDGSLTASVQIDGISLDPGTYYVDIGLFEREWRLAYDLHSWVYPLVVQRPAGVRPVPGPWEAAWSVQGARPSSAGSPQPRVG